MNNTKMSTAKMDCPICGKEYTATQIESHVNKCLFLNDELMSNKKDQKKIVSGGGTAAAAGGINDDSNKRSFPVSSMSRSNSEPAAKKAKYQSGVQSQNENIVSSRDYEQVGNFNSQSLTQSKIFKQYNDRLDMRNDVQKPNHNKGTLPVNKKSNKDQHVPLAEKVRPTGLANYVGQKQVLGPKSVLLQLLEKGEIPSMILWGPPGCGKTSLATVISQICKQTPDGRMRYVKLSAAMSGVNDVKEAVSRAANELKFGRRTVMFMDEIHRFNKLQQDIFLPHIEAGTITLIGATTENPCFSLNSALLSRCRVVVLEKLTTPDLNMIIKNAVTFANGKVHAAGESDATKTIKDKESDTDSRDSSSSEDDSFTPIFIIDEPTIQWLAETCDGDARIALGGLELAIQSKSPNEEEFLQNGPGLITLDDVKDSLKKSHVLYDKKGDQHYDMISALHKSVRASDENATVYWLARMIAGGEDPMYIARRLVRMASEDVGLADPQALVLAVSVMNACKMIGMPESDVLLAQCAIYLARAPKSRLMEDALRSAQRLIANQKGQQPAVPVHLRGTGSSRLVKLLGNGKGYNMLHKDESGLNYMPKELEDVNFFEEDELGSITG